MTKKWTKSELTKYFFSIDNIEIGTLEIFSNTLDGKAIAKIGDNEFIIKRTGFWKSAIEITDQSDAIIAKVYAEKWYAHTLNLDFKTTKYKVSIRNNPLAEWAIIEGNKDLLVYGLNIENSNGMVNVKIGSAEDNNDYILDYLLWYLFVPMAEEEMGDNFTFTMFNNAQ